ncbi:MAG: hypothetical protein IID59_07485 [Proteobacteria bacterium]|nr:hypothetical protein [Pseudomonadota bacterium]
MKKSARIFCFAVSVIVLLVSGCKKTYFDLELHPDGKTILKYSFVGEFQYLTPNDIGGSGFLLHCDSALGSSSMYSEQFRGKDDLADVLRRQDLWNLSLAMSTLSIVGTASGFAHPESTVLQQW